MRHVDDGTLHAWLDGAVTDEAGAAWIDEHVRGCDACAARLADARATIAQADELLTRRRPVAETPPFDLVLERAGARRAGGIRTRRWIAPASWAASVALAAALGWAARDRLEPNAPGAPESVIAEAPAPPSPAGGGLARQAPRGSVSRPAAAVSPGLPRQVETAREAARTGAAAAVPPPASSESAAPAPPPVGDDPQPVQAPNPEPETRTADSALATADLARAAERATPRPAAGTPGRASPALVPQPGAAGATVSGLSPAVDIHAARRRPAAVASPAPVLGGTVALDEAAVVPGWRVVSRTEAAAATGMPLYGIDGIPPSSTAVDAQSNSVRTVYQLPSGSMLELVQQPLKEPSPGALFSRPAEALAEAGARRAEAGIAPSPAWSGVRGNARLTLRPLSGTADVSAFSTRLRLD